MSEDNHIDNLHSVYQWEDMREAILKGRYPNLWEKYKDKEPKNREPTL